MIHYICWFIFKTWFDLIHIGKKFFYSYGRSFVRNHLPTHLYHWIWILLCRINCFLKQPVCFLHRNTLKLGNILQHSIKFILLHIITSLPQYITL